ncbi:hypothetical protein [Tessaracoccus caeni]|uniref:hypothetical protein n=1 Tax=Tessaracoccus caeni TaxID=3031239 RepID=UPI0023DABEB6|nr:hypothetical protein [Tessaracoccus caeni]MDF1488468.1 hypothetical protein [Tessaracoccus caeni]
MRLPGNPARRGPIQIEGPLWLPIDLDAPLQGRAVLLVAGSDVLVADLASHGSATSSFWSERLLGVTQWRNIGPLPRTRVREVSWRATVESLAIAQELVPERAFRLAAVHWRPLRPPLLLPRESGRWLTVNEALASLPANNGPRARAEAQVAEVRESYGRMLGDIAYRIENAALFDSAVPLTKQFDTALALWADVTDATPEDEAVRRASLVKVTFETARANAETLGLAHLPQTARDPARRAAGAARLAARSTNDAERETATAQVVQILGSLALYYLPKPEDFRKAIE